MPQKLYVIEISNAFDKLKTAPKTENSIKENSHNIDNGIKTMILDSMDKFRGKKICLDTDAIFDFLSKMVVTNIDKDTHWQIPYHN